MDNVIPFSDFKKLDLRIAKIIVAERVSDSEKLLRLEVDLGPPSPRQGGATEGQATERRQLVAGIGKSYEPEALIGKEIVIVANLEPRKLMGLESQGMLLAASDTAGPVLLIPDRNVQPGTSVM